MNGILILRVFRKYLNCSTVSKDLFPIFMMQVKHKAGYKKWVSYQYKNYVKEFVLLYCIITHYGDSQFDQWGLINVFLKPNK